MRVSSRCSGNCHARICLLWSGMVRQDDNPSLGIGITNIRSLKAERNCGCPTLRAFAKGGIRDR